MKSEITWNKLPALPPKDKQVLLLVYNEMYDKVEVTQGCYDEDGFNDNPPIGTATIFEDVLAWAEYPTVGVVLNRQGTNQVYVSSPW